MWWVSNWLMCQAQKVIMNGVTSDWSPVTTGVPQGFILGPVLFIIINDLDAGLEGILSKFADNTKLGEAPDSLKGREGLQRDLDKLVGWTITKHIKFNKKKCEILHLEWGNPGCLYSLWNEMPESSAMERDLGILVNGDRLSWIRWTDVFFHETLLCGVKVTASHLNTIEYTGGEGQKLTVGDGTYMDMEEWRKERDKETDFHVWKVQEEQA
ncbi:rna-directed dna polymerase from mobile element jockey-like [Willisornis vidua]|uniref:Rna-directed dna polymerase from mobile element jockey-like n=1 Tax=Willisornis vidua TaxID=1566151 RepID=A0ABQ9D2M8_9PASS|nr:rna-directed dna polymerase from mobile element jockey-like [Willisornis vidua]